MTEVSKALADSIDYAIRTEGKATLYEKPALLVIAALRATPAPTTEPVNLTDGVLDAALSEFWDVSPRGSWTDSQRVGMRKAILTALGVAPSRPDRGGAAK